MQHTYTNLLAALAAGDPAAREMVGSLSSARRIAPDMLAADASVRADFGGNSEQLATHLVAEAHRMAQRSQAPQRAAESREHDLRLLATLVDGSAGLTLATLEEAVAAGLDAAFAAVQPSACERTAARICRCDQAARAEFGEPEILAGYLGTLRSHSSFVSGPLVTAQPYNDAQMIALCRAEAEQEHAAAAAAADDSNEKGEEQKPTEPAVVDPLPVGAMAPHKTTQQHPAALDADDDLGRSWADTWDAWEAARRKRFKVLGWTYKPRPRPQWAKR